MVSVCWEFVSLVKKEAVEGDPKPSWSSGAQEKKVTVILYSPGPGPSVTYHLRRQLPSVGQEGSGQEDSAVQICSRIWRDSWGARWWPRGNGSIWPEAQHHQDQVTNTWKQKAGEIRPNSGSEGVGLGSRFLSLRKTSQSTGPAWV